MESVQRMKSLVGLGDSGAYTPSLLMDATHSLGSQSLQAPAY